MNVFEAVFVALAKNANPYNIWVRSVALNADQAEKNDTNRIKDGPREGFMSCFVDCLDDLNKMIYKNQQRHSRLSGTFRPVCLASRRSPGALWEL